MRVINSNSLIVTIFFPLFISNISTAQVWEEWLATYNGRGDCRDEIEAIALDMYGNVYVTGFADRALHYSYTDDDFTTIKYSNSGELLWAANYYTYMDCNDRAYGLVVDVEGSVYVTGESHDPRYISHYATVKYSTDGVQEWVDLYDGPGESDDTPEALAIDDFGNVYVTGTSDGEDSGYDFATIKYTPTGEREWVARFNGPDNRDDYASSLAVDSESNVYVAGNCQNSMWQRVITTVKYDANGEEMWTAQLDLPEFGLEDCASEIVLDGEGSVFVTGKRLTFSSLTDEYYTDIITVKYDCSGIEQWVVTNTCCQYTSLFPVSIAIDPGGEIILCTDGVDGATDFDWIILKYDSEGNELWRTVYCGSGNCDDDPCDLVVDDAGDIYVVGEVVGEDPYYTQYCATVKYNSDGVEQWAMLYSGESYSASGNVITTDGYGQVFVGGYCVGDTTGNDYLTIRYSQPVGIEEQPVKSHPAIFCLYGPFPNPFNATTTFSCQLSVYSYVELEIFDLNGRKLETLAAGWREPGHHEMTLDASDLPSGIYLYRLEAAEDVFVGKLALIK